MDSKIKNTATSLEAEIERNIALLKNAKKLLDDNSNDKDMCANIFEYLAIKAARIKNLRAAKAILEE